MNDIDQIRKANARALADSLDTHADFAEKIDRVPTQVSRIIGKNATKGIGNRMARHIEECFGKPRGWLDQLHQEQAVAPHEDAAQPLGSRVQLTPEQVDVLRELITRTERILLTSDRKLDAKQRASVIAAAFATCLSQGITAKDLSDDLVLASVNTAIQSPSA